MEIIILMGSILAIGVIGHKIANSKRFEHIKSPKQMNKENLNKIIDESGAQGIVFRAFNNSSAAILDKENEKLHVFYSTYQEPIGKIHTYEHFHCNFADIIESEVIVDNQTITKTARGSQLGGALVGSVLAGGIGAIIGGLSGSKRSDDYIKRAEIKLTINDLENPVCKITFLDGQDEDHKVLKKGFRKNDFRIKGMLQELDKWQAMFDVILNNKKIS